MSLEPLSTAYLWAASAALFLCACLSSLRSRVLPRQRRIRVRRMIDYGVLLQPCEARCGKQIVGKVGGAFDAHGGCNPRRLDEDLSRVGASGTCLGPSLLNALKECSARLCRWSSISGLAANRAAMRSRTACSPGARRGGLTRCSAISAHALHASRLALKP